MKAAIQAEGEQTNGWGHKVKGKFWTISDRPEIIFSADDQGRAIFVESLDALKAELDLKLSPPSGCNYFIDCREVSREYLRKNLIYETDIPVAKRSASWEEICNSARSHGPILVSADHPAFPKDAYQSYATKLFDEESCADVFGFDNEFCARSATKSYWVNNERFLEVQFNPKIARKLQGYRKNSEKRKRKKSPTEPTFYVSKLSIVDLRRLHSLFVRAVFGELSNSRIDSSLRILPPPEYDTASKRNNFIRIGLIQQINELRKLCIRLKRDWKNTCFDNFYSYDETIAQELVKYWDYIPNLLKSENEHFLTFGKWLRLEHLRFKKQQKELASTEKSETSEIAKAANPILRVSETHDENSQVDSKCIESPVAIASRTISATPAPKPSPKPKAAFDSDQNAPAIPW